MANDCDVESCRLKESIKDSRTHVFVCKLDPETDGEYASGKWKPSGAADGQSDCRWFSLTEVLSTTNRANSVAAWVQVLLEKNQEKLMPYNAKARSQQPQQSAANVRPNGAASAGAEATPPNAQPHAKSQVAPPLLL